MDSCPVLFDNHIAFNKNSSYDFHLYDDKERFETNLKSQPIDWKYRDSEGKLTYTFDQYGFRNNIDLDQISHDSYIAAVGCSPTMGTGQFHEETYVSYLQELTSLPVYNMGLGAASHEVGIYNILWLLTNFNAPKVLVFQNTASSRFPIFHLKTPHENEVLFAGPWVSVWGPAFEDLEKFMALGDYYRYTELKTLMWKTMLTQLCDKFGVLLVELDINQELVNYGKTPDLARDLTHYGVEFNRYLANVLQERIDENINMR